MILHCFFYSTSTEAILHSLQQQLNSVSGFEQGPTVHAPCLILIQDTQGSVFVSTGKRILNF